MTKEWVLKIRADYADNDTNYVQLKNTSKSQFIHRKKSDLRDCIQHFFMILHSHDLSTKNNKSHQKLFQPQFIHWENSDIRDWTGTAFHYSTFPWILALQEQQSHQNSSSLDLFIQVRHKRLHATTFYDFTSPIIRGNKHLQLQPYLSPITRQKCITVNSNVANQSNIVFRSPWQHRKPNQPRDTSMSSEKIAAVLDASHEPKSHRLLVSKPSTWHVKHQPQLRSHDGSSIIIHKELHIDWSWLYFW